MHTHLSLGSPRHELQAIGEAVFSLLAGPEASLRLDWTMRWRFEGTLRGKVAVS